MEVQPKWSLILGVIGVFALTSAIPARADESSTPNDSGSVVIVTPPPVPTVPVPPLPPVSEETDSGEVQAPDNSGTPATPPKTSGKPEGKTRENKKEDRPVRPDWAPGTQISAQVKQLNEDFKKERRELVQRYREMKKDTADLEGEERARARESLNVEFRQLREEMIARQKELRDELHTRFADFKTAHEEHAELIEAAKENAAEKARERRGRKGD